MGQPGEHWKWQGLLPGLCHKRAAEARAMGVVETALNWMGRCVEPKRVFQALRASGIFFSCVICAWEM